MRRTAVAVVAALFLAGASPTALSQVSGVTGPLVDADGWQLVYAHCSACHSLRLVASQRGDRATWLRLIRWMQETQNLWQFEPTVEERIIDYLAANYAPSPVTRRAPLPAELMP
jgi:hypothetical protein